MRKSLTAVTALALAGLAVALGRGDTPKSATPDEQAIRQAVADYAAALTKGDLARITAYWTPDAEYTDENGATHKGREAIVALFKKGLEAAKGANYAMRTTSLRFIRPDVALQDGEIDMTPPGGALDRGKFTAVWVKANGTWQVSSAHDLPDEAAAADAAQQLKGLEWMAGEWASEDKAALVTLTCKWGLNKHFLMQEYTVPEKDGPFTIVQWVGHDAAADAVRSWVFDSKGGHAGGLWAQDGHTWLADMAGVLPDGRTGTAKIQFKYLDDNSFLYQSTDREVDGRPVPDTTVKYVRKAARP